MDFSIRRDSGFRARVRTSTLRFFLWGVAWVAVTALAKFGPRSFWRESPGLTLLAVGLDLAVGVGWVLAVRNYVAELDELQRKIYLDALAVAVGVTLIAGVPYSILGTYGILSSGAEIGHLLALMGTAFLVSFLYGTWRYR